MDAKGNLWFLLDQNRKGMELLPHRLEVICLMTWIWVHLCVIMIFSQVNKWQPNLQRPVMSSSAHPPFPGEMEAIWEKFSAYYLNFNHSSNLALIITHILFRCKFNENILCLKLKVIEEIWTFKVKEFHAINKACQAGAQMISQLAKGSYLYSPQSTIKWKPEKNYSYIRGEFLLAFYLPKSEHMDSDSMTFSYLN